ncbi:peptidase inhibitor family I36 protein [Streptomyces sp. NPDC093591]|uniref:peptidase inhibitor family I36 protein n=1 Tax=Streptomyces sp. NPDC093591 TaxID=3366044 RepID=UPI003807152F
MRDRQRSLTGSRRRQVRNGLVTAAVLAGALAMTHPASAQPLATASWHAYSSTGFSGPDAWFTGNTGQCKYVGAGWNDRVRSARTESSARVELWEHANCTGYAITIDSSGYGSIGPWVSAYRVTYP